MCKKLCAWLCVLVSLVFCPLSVVAGTGQWTRHEDGQYYATDGVTEGVTARGIDVSKYQGDIDWDTLYREEYLTGDLDFVIIRCGYGSDYTSQDDEKFRRNADACTRLGIPFGVYLYSYANTEAKARSEAAHALRLLEGYKLSYPVYYDLEDKTVNLGQDFLTRIAYIFCDTLKAAGYEVGIYSMRNWFDNGNLSAIDCAGKGYSKWIAQFGGNRLYYSGGYDIWQCTSSGTVAGIDGRCDINFSFMPRRTVNHSRITLNSNAYEAVGTLPAPYYVKVVRVLGALPTLTRAGYTFEGWYTAEHGGEKVIETTLVENTEERTLYAHWSRVTEATTTSTTTTATKVTTTTTKVTTTTTTTTTTTKPVATTASVATTRYTVPVPTAATTTVATTTATGTTASTTVAPVVSTTTAPTTPTEPELPAGAAGEEDTTPTWLWILIPAVGCDLVGAAVLVLCNLRKKQNIE